MEKSRYLLKNMGILTISNFSSKILVFLLVPLYTSVLSTTEYGSYDLAISTATLLYPILSLNIVDSVMRFTMDIDSDKKKIASIGIRFVSFSIPLFGIVMYALNSTDLWPEIKGLEVYIFLYYISYVYNQFLIQFTKGLERVVELGVAGVISTLVTILLNILFLLVFRWGLTGFFFANILAQFISTLYLMVSVRLWNYISCSPRDKVLQKEMLVYSIPLISTVVGWWINCTADKYIVTIMLGVSANGLLAVSYKIPQIINTLQGIFVQAWQISAIKEYGDKNTAFFYGKTFSVINFLMCVACSLLILLTRPLAKVLYAKEFYAAWQYVPLLLIASVLNCAAGLLGPILSAQKKSKAMMWSALIGALVNIVLNIVLIKIWGVQGATLATAISSFIIYLVRKIAVGNEICIKNYLKILLTWILLCIQAWLEICKVSHLLEIIVVIILLIINIKLLLYLSVLGKNAFKSIIKN